MRRLLAPIAIQNDKNAVVSVDLPAFVQRLLLFDTYILQSVWLEDLRMLSGTFGASGLRSLFEAEALKLYCESFTVGEFGRARADLNLSGNNKRLPLGSYSFSVLRVRNQQQRIDLALESLDTTLGSAARENLLAIDPKAFSGQVFEGFYGDLRRNAGVLEAAIKLELHKQGVKPNRLQIRVEEMEVEDFRVDSNIRSEYGMSEGTSHKLIERSLLALAGLNQRFAEMITHEALSGITVDDLALMQGKLRFAANQITVDNNDPRFERLARVVELPIPLLHSTKIDAEKLLRLRESDECRSFRDWLAQTDSLSDKELQVRTRGFKSRVSAALNSRWGSGIRLLVSNGISLVPFIGTVAGIAASVVDKFVLEKLAPKDAVVSFLSQSYPSLFKPNK